MVYVIQVTVTACEQDQDGTAVPSWSCSQTVSKPVWHIPLLCVQWKTPDDGQRNCPKCVEFYSKNKFEKFSASSWFYYKNLVWLIQWIMVFIRVKKQVELWLYYIWLPNRALEDNSVGTKYCQAFPEFYREYNFHLLFPPTPIPM